MNPLPITPPATSHPRRHRQGPLHTSWRSHHCRRHPPTPSSSATAAIVTITGLIVAWCRLIPSSSSPLSSTAAATPPTTASPPHHLVLLPPCDPPPPVAAAPSPPSRSPMAPSWTGMRRRFALPPGPTRQVPLPHAPPSSGYGPIAPAPPSQTPQCLGLHRPSFASRAAAAGWATAPAARRR